MKILYLGTPDFAVEPLKILVENGFNIVGVVTAPDKPAGRGLKLQETPVKKYAQEQGLTVFQPTNLKSDEFYAQLEAIQPDLGIVVAFRMLPEKVWAFPKFGTFNLHASLLPQYRGAAPINWAIMNGEKKTGVTTFFLKHEIDTGNIIFQEEVAIEENDTAGELHDKLMFVGAKLVLKTAQAMQMEKFETINQEVLVNNQKEIKHAPKIFKEDCLIDWHRIAIIVHNKIRGLSPYPTAYTNFLSPDGNTYPVKIFKTKIHHSSGVPGKIESDGKTFLRVFAVENALEILELQLAGKKKMPIDEFLRGFKMNNLWRIEQKSFL